MATETAREPIFLTPDSYAAMQIYLADAVRGLAEGSLEFGTLATGNVRRLPDGTLLSFTVMLIRPEHFENDV